MNASKRPLLNRATAVIGALLSALSVVYATSLLAALIGAAVFFVFYRLLGPAPAASEAETKPQAPAAGPRNAEARRAA